MVCKAFPVSLESSNFNCQTIMKSLTANQQDLCFIYFLLKSDRHLAKSLTDISQKKIGENQKNISYDKIYLI